MEFFGVYAHRLHAPPSFRESRYYAWPKAKINVNRHSRVLAGSNDLYLSHGEPESDSRGGGTYAWGRRMMRPAQETPLAVKVYSERDADLSALREATIAVIGYGNQGHAHALNLRDSGLKILVGQRPDGPGWRRAVGDDFAPLPIDQAVMQSDFTILALPDMAAPAAYREHIEPHLRAGQAHGFIHGFNIHYKQIQPRDDIDVIMVAPKGAGYMVRRAFQDGRGLPAMVAVEQDASGKSADRCEARFRRRTRRRAHTRY